MCGYEVSHTKSLRNARRVRRGGTYRCSAIAPEATSAGAHTHTHLAVMTGRGAAKGTKSGGRQLGSLGTRVDAVAGASTAISKDLYQSTLASSTKCNVLTTSRCLTGMHKALAQRDNSDRPDETKAADRSWVESPMGRRGTALGPTNLIVTVRLSMCGIQGV